MFRARIMSIVVFCGLFFTFHGFALAGQKLEVPGTGSCQGVLRELAKDFNRENSDLEIIVPPSIGSGGGIREVMAGRSELARVARSLKPREVGEGLRCAAFAEDLLVFAVGERVDLRRLNLAQLRAVYTGEIVNWSELGERDMPIRVLSRQPGETNLKRVTSQLKCFQPEEITDRAKILYTDQDMLDMIEKYPSSIGFGTRSELLVRGITSMITLGDMKPEPEEASAGRYPLTTTYCLVFKEKGLSDAGRRFVDYVFSQGGRDRIRKYGLIPVGKNPD